MLHASAVRANGGQFVFPLDDTYIHLTTARNLALHGSFGINPGEYAPASSAPLWSVLLSFLFSVGGVNQNWALTMSFASGVLLLFVCSVLLFRMRTGAIAKLIASGLILFATPMPLLALSGMEPLLHAALTIPIVFGAASILAREPNPFPPVGRMLALLAIATVTRFETIFLVIIFAGFLLLQKRWRLSLAVLAAGALPILITGTISASHGWFWLPSSVLVKSAKPSTETLLLAYTALGVRFGRAIWHCPPLLLLMLVMVGLYLRKTRKPRCAADWMLLLSICLFAFHLQFAATGSVMRYEAYLVALGILVVTVNIDRNTIAIVILLASVPLAQRAFDAIVLVKPASHNIFEQQFQIARFLNENYGHASVAMNDIGAITFFTDIQCLDLAGLANLPIATAILHRNYDTSLIAAEAHDRAAKIAVVYDSWFDGKDLPRLPRSWIPVGTWAVPDNVVLGGKSVTFYAMNLPDADELSARLRRFEPNLPVGVAVSRH